MNVTQFHLTPTVYARANHLKTEIAIALSYANRHANKAEEISDFFAPIPAAATAGTLLPLALKPQRYMRAGELRAEIKAALNYCKAFANKRTAIATFFTAVADAAAEIAGVVATLTVTPSGQLDDAVGSAEATYTFSATGGTGPYTYTVVEGDPFGGNYTFDDGDMIGTPAYFGTPYSFSFTVRAEDSLGAFGTAECTIDVVAP